MLKLMTSSTLPRNRIAQDCTCLIERLLSFHIRHLIFDIHLTTIFWQTQVSLEVVTAEAAFRVSVEESVGMWLVVLVSTYTRSLRAAAPTRLYMVR